MTPAKVESAVTGGDGQVLTDPPTRAGNSEPAATHVAAGLESNRWLLALGVPLLVACAFVAASFATEVRWLFVPAVALPPVWMGILAYLAISSDTNGGAVVHSLPVPARERKAA